MVVGGSVEMIREFMERWRRALRAGDKVAGCLEYLGVILAVALGAAVIVLWAFYPWVVTPILLLAFLVVTARAVRHVWRDYA